MAEDETQQETSATKKSKPMHVLRAVRPHFHGREATAKEEIVTAIREGELRISAKSWISEVPPSKEVWEAGAPEGVKRKWIRPQTFIGARFWEQDAKNWKWKSGKFYLTRRDQQSWRLMERVRFDEQDVRNFIERLRNEKPGAGGRPKNVDEWNIALIRIVQMAQNGELTAEVLNSQKGFVRAFRDGLEPELSLNLTDSTLRPINQLVREKIKPVTEAERIARANEGAG